VAGSPRAIYTDGRTLLGPVSFLQQPATFERPSHKGRIAPE